MPNNAQDMFDVLLKKHPNKGHIHHKNTDKASQTRRHQTPDESIYWSMIGGVPVVLCFSEHACLQARRFTHHAGIPRWVKHQIDMHVGDGGNQQNLGTYVVHQNLAHAAAGRG